MALLKKALSSNLALNILGTGLVVFLSGFFWLDLENLASLSAINQITRVLVIVLGLVSIYLIFTRSFPNLPILFLVFTGCYFLYEQFFAHSWPIYLILTFFFVILWLIFPIFHIKINHGIYFFLFVLTLFEVFVALSYWLVNPMTRSMIMAITAYLFGGWLLNLENKDNKLMNGYYFYALVAFLTILLTSHWGR